MACCRALKDHGPVPLLCKPVGHMQVAISRKAARAQNKRLVGLLHHRLCWSPRQKDSSHCFPSSKNSTRQKPSFASTSCAPDCPSLFYFQALSWVCDTTDRFSLHRLQPNSKPASWRSHPRYLHWNCGRSQTLQPQLWIISWFAPTNTLFMTGLILRR